MDEGGGGGGGKLEGTERVEEKGGQRHLYYTLDLYPEGKDGEKRIRDSSRYSFWGSFNLPP